MPEICGVCSNAESKYKCPICQVRYCSIPCYKKHKIIHDADSTNTQAPNDQPQPKPVDRPGTTQRVPKIDFTGFEKDADFQRLLTRYPNLKHQLQLVYGLTLEPGPEEAMSWNRRDYFPTDQALAAGRGSRGRGSTRGRGRGGRMQLAQDERIRGPWTQEKSDKQGRDVIQRMRDTQGGGGELAEGMIEFTQLCQLKFGEKE